MTLTPKLLAELVGTYPLIQRRKISASAMGLQAGPLPAPPA